MDVKSFLKSIFADDMFNFDVFIKLKNRDELQRIQLYEGDPRKIDDSENLKGKLRKDIRDYIISSYLSDETEYTASENIANNQNVYYIISQSNQYKPFEFLNLELENAPVFDDREISNVKGVVFKFRRGDSVLWAYQHTYLVTVPKSANKYLLTRQAGNCYKELDKQVFPISKKVDILVIGEDIITNNIKMMENQFALDSFIRNEANSVMNTIVECDFLGDIAVLSKYVNGDKLSYSKKLMRIKDSPVLRMSSTKLMKKIQILPYYSDAIKIENNKIQITTKKQVDIFIKMLNDDFVKSELTDTNYDAEVKKIN